MKVELELKLDYEWAAFMCLQRREFGMYFKYMELAKYWADRIGTVISTPLGCRTMRQKHERFY